MELSRVLRQGARFRMKILYVTIKDLSKQGDYLEVIALRALRSVLGDHCIDYPKKKILYGDWSEVEKSSLHGAGFSLYEPSIRDIPNRDYSDVDVVVYGFIDNYKKTYVSDKYPELANLNKPVVYIDGHDEAVIVKTPCFKHELYEPTSDVYPMNLALPSSKIRPIDLSAKTQLIQQTAPPYSKFGPQIMGIPGRQLYIFENEKDYYDDMSKSWFGLSCRKGSWDSLRNYEIIASGALLLFRDYIQKPELASPSAVPAISYSSSIELENIINALLPNGKPSQEYLNIIESQRNWLLENAVEEKLGEYMVSTIEKEILKR